MTNEIIFVTAAILDFALIITILRLDKSYMFVVIALNILLVGVFGAKLAPLFGFVTNIGNVFYAAAFFATQLLVERYGKKEAQKSIWIGACSVVFFMLMAQLTILTAGLPATRGVNNAIDVLFAAAPRVALASFIAYVVSQTTNIWLFSFIRKKTEGKQLYLRVNTANIVGQAIDSVLFFAIAFYGIISVPMLLQAIFVGYTLKVFAGAISTFFFYLSGTSQPPSR